jgi:hypothetical protein
LFEIILAFLNLYIILAFLCQYSLKKILMQIRIFLRLYSWMHNSLLLSQIFLRTIFYYRITYIFPKNC